MTFLSRIFGGRSGREKLLPLYSAVVAAGRDPVWYRDGRVPDTVDGRFDMISAVFALMLLRLETEESARDAPGLLTELFIEDMDGSIRQLGTGDLVVGKRMGKIMGALGGRLGAFRTAIAAGESLDKVVRRNIFRDAPPSEAAVAFVSERLGAFHQRLLATPLQSLLDGRVPAR